MKESVEVKFLLFAAFVIAISSQATWVLIWVAGLSAKAALPATRGTTRAVPQSLSCQAAFLCSTEGRVEPLIAICRGFMASGTSRTKSTWSNPSTKLAPFTCT